MFNTPEGENCSGLFDIPKAEVLRYLGYKNQSLTDELDLKIDNAILLCKNIMRPKIIFRKYALDGFTLKGTNFTLEGADIKNYLIGYTDVIILAATLGLDIDRKLTELTATDKTMALVFDSAGSAAIESYLDIECKKLFDTIDRFSCGYGDFPLSANYDICNLLNTSKFCGITVTSNYLLSPKKSVTAVIGIGQDKTISALCNFRCVDCEHIKCLYKK